MEYKFYFIVAYVVGCVGCAIAGSFGRIGALKGAIAGLFLTPVFGMCVVLASMLQEGVDVMYDLLDGLTEEVPDDPEAK